MRRSTSADCGLARFAFISAGRGGLPLAWRFWPGVARACKAADGGHRARVDVASCGAGIAVFHVGVEQHWWRGLASCGGVSDMPTTVEALKKQIMSAPVVRCDEVAWSFPRYFDGGLQCPDFNGGRRRGLYLAWRHGRAAL